MSDSIGAYHPYMLQNPDLTGQAISGVQVLQDLCHGQSTYSGWWTDLQTGEPKKLTQEMIGDKMMLIVTEVAEAKEGHRKNLMDTHLPNRPMVEVEFADAIIRILDTAGALKLDVAGALIEKLRYNAMRADHTIEARKGEHGKKS